uniref:Uncharacterized protein n=1 Tax=Chromera velia CCMP2878 TaxID=1169474 RepID=A0A0G4F4P1_9ALVE|eukprot:Cvel_15059.t1-p1 / transcript=Cvel_15059.t1 / gene=Cvel_15059 / organism=Chromera_velia_CCMP2878 / gene_product=hypothetical protein / transcript_product=hypothetical protein / location=Cvel_scaffold1097:23964-24647(+) / protein_length=167 / sequence_SO=supercontig / SO=protein_coding / is_pseudo=false
MPPVDVYNKSKTPSTCLTSASFSSSSSLCATPRQPSFTENAGSLQGSHHDAGPPAACVAPSSSSSGGSGFGSSDAAEPESRSLCTHPSPSASPAAEKGKETSYQEGEGEGTEQEEKQEGGPEEGKGKEGEEVDQSMKAGRKEGGETLSPDSQTESNLLATEESPDIP